MVKVSMKQHFVFVLSALLCQSLSVAAPLSRSEARAAVEEATARYRGDFPSRMAFPVTSRQDFRDSFIRDLWERYPFSSLFQRPSAWHVPLRLDESRENP